MYMDLYDGGDTTESTLSGGASLDREPSLFGHLFTFDTEYKHDILNLLQYSFIALIPCVLLNKFIQYNIPEACPNKSSIEISLEIILQIVLLLVGLWFIDRFTTYFKTYSTTAYPKHNVLFFSLGLITILISIQSKLGEKINILFDRLLTYINGPNSMKLSKLNYKPQQQSMPDVQVLGNMNNLQMDTTNISNLPVINQSLQSGPIQQSVFNTSNSQQKQSLNQQQSMYSSGGGGGGNYDAPILMSDEPMPANMGMGSFGTAW